MWSLKLGVALAFGLAGAAFAADPAPSAGSPAVASPAGAPAKAAPSGVADDKKGAKPKDKLICTREEIIGSKFSKRVCRTETQVQEERAFTKKLNEQIRDEGYAPPLPNG
jgi:hypothetical protein